MNRPQQGQPNYTAVTIKDVHDVVERVIHKNPDRGYRAGELYRELPSGTRLDLVSVTGLCKYLLLHQEELDLDQVRVEFPQRTNGPHDGLISVFFSCRDEAEPSVVGVPPKGKAPSLTLGSGHN